MSREKSGGCDDNIEKGENIVFILQKYNVGWNNRLYMIGGWIKNYNLIQCM